MPLITKDKKNPEFIEVPKLLLDIKNYRLPLEEAHKADQAELLKILERDFGLNTIAESMIDNGYFAEEPLIVIPGPSDSFIVVEGNRRLATLKFLVQEEYRPLSYQQKYWENAAGRLKYDLSRVPVLKYSNRQELTRFLGFRHIAGILRWDPLSKARFINALIEQKDKNADFAEVARETGSIKTTTRDNYIAYRAFLQARDKFDIDTKNLERNFSVFYRALANPSITEFIGLTKDLSPSRLKYPIPPRKAEALKEVIEFIHGTSQVAPVLTDSRQLTDLGEVLAKKESTNHLRKHKNLSQAFMIAGGEIKRLTENINQAIYYLKEALRDAYAYKANNEVQELMEKLWNTSHEVFRNYPNVLNKTR